MSEAPGQSFVISVHGAGTWAQEVTQLLKEYLESSGAKVEAQDLAANGVRLIVCDRRSQASSSINRTEEPRPIVRVFIGGSVAEFHTPSDVILHANQPPEVAVGRIGQKLAELRLVDWRAFSAYTLEEEEEIRRRLEGLGYF